MLGRIVTIAACAALAACNMYTAPGATPSAFDGTYTGSMTALHVGGGNMSMSCGATAGTTDGSLPVMNGTVVWSASPSLKLYAPIARDGSFAAQNGQIFFAGKITNRSMVARSNTGVCHTIYDLTKAA